MKNLYSIHYIASDGAAFFGRYFHRKSAAITNAKFNLGKRASIHNSTVIVRATVYQNDSIPVALLGDLRVNPVTQ